MSQFCIIAFYETDEPTRDKPFVVGGFDSQAKARAYAVRDEKLSGATKIEIAPYLQASGVSQEPLFTLYFEGQFEKIFDLHDWFETQTAHDDTDDCLEILRTLERAGTTTWAEVDYRLNDVTEFRKALRNLLAEVVPALGDQLEQKDAWYELLDQLNVKLEQAAAELRMTVNAEAHSDDYQREISFDATPWFVQASDQNIAELVECGFGGDYPADYVMLHFEEILPDVDSLLAWSRGDGNTGFEVHVNETEARAWIASFRPQLATKLGL